MTRLQPLRSALALAVASGLGLAAATPAPAAPPTPVQLVVVDVKTVALGYRASQLIGHAIFNDHNQQIGKIDDLIVRRDKVLFVVLGVGGFLGMGQHLVVAPYDRLQLSGDHIVLPGATKEALLKLPEFHYTH